MRPLGFVSGLISSSIMHNESAQIIQNGTMTQILPFSDPFIASEYVTSSHESELYSGDISATSPLLSQTIYSDYALPGINSITKETNQTQTFSLEGSSLMTGNTTMSESTSPYLTVINENQTIQDHYLVSSMAVNHQNSYSSFAATTNMYNSAPVNRTEVLNDTVTSSITSSLFADLKISQENIFHTSFISESHISPNQSQSSIHSMGSGFLQESESKTNNFRTSMSETMKNIKPTSTVFVISSLTTKNKTFETESLGFSSNMSSDIFSSLLNSTLGNKDNIEQTSSLPSSTLGNKDNVEHISQTSVSDIFPAFESTMKPPSITFMTNFPSVASSYSSIHLQTTQSYPNLTSATVFEKLSTTTVATPTIHSKKLYKFNFEIEFTGECRSLESNEAIAEMWGGLVNIMIRESGMKDIAIEPINILCQPLRLSFTVYNTTHKNLTEKLQLLVENNTFIITVIVDQYKTVFIAKRIYSYSESDMNSDMFLFGLNEVDIIIIICAASISVILVCAGLLICAREYYLRKRTRSFTLSSFMSKSSKSYDYSLTKMPRPNSTYSENGVRFKSIDVGDGQQTSLLPKEEQETSISELQLKVNSNDNGIIVGVTGIGYNKVNHDVTEVLTQDQGDQSEEMLCPKTEETAQSVDNPIYFADDERFLDV